MIMNESQTKMSEILHQIINNEDEDSMNYYGVMINVYQDIDKYLEQLDDINDKIYLAQWCNNFSKIEELIKEITLPEYEKNKYLELKSKNIEIDETINFKILSEKYQFLDNIIDMITADRDVQDQILSLSDSRLKLFKKMYTRLQELTDYFNPYIVLILRRIGYVSLDTHWKNRFHKYDELLKNIDDLISNGYELNDKEIDTLLYLCTSSGHYTVPDINELDLFGDRESLDNIYKSEWLLYQEDKKDLELIKSTVLSKIYGISLESADDICKRFDISQIDITQENKDVFEMYMAIYQIINEKDFDVLNEVYHEFMKTLRPAADFRRMIVFENDLRKAFAHDLNRQVYKTDNQNFTKINGVEVYDAGTEFKMIVTAIGSYDVSFKNQENYSKYWNSPKIRSHGNCCSLIGNVNLSMAQVKNIILGFSTMSDNMLVLSGSSDINSTPNSRIFAITEHIGQKYMSADQMLDNTRADYNELVYERRDLSSNPKFYKKNPDYIVFIEEYESFEEMFHKYKNEPKKLAYLIRQKEILDERWQETIKAAKDFNIPIVKINRERVAKSEFSKIKQMVSEFMVNKDPNLLTLIITKFESNRVGNAGLHAPIREKLFSQEKMSEILNDIKSTINQETDLETRNNLYSSLYKSITEEQKKVESCNYYRHKKQTPGIDFDKELEEIKQILENNNINHSMMGSKK